MITGEKIGVSTVAINYLWAFMYSPEVIRTLPRDESPAMFYWFVREWEQGSIMIYIPRDGDNPMGMCNARLRSADTVEVHCGFFKDCWGPRALAGARACMDALVDDLGGVVKTMVSDIPVVNRRSISFARRLGFTGDHIETTEQYGLCRTMTMEV